MQTNETAKSSVQRPETTFESESNERSTKELLTVAEAAELLGMKEATVRSWTLKRKITYIKLGRIVRIPNEGTPLTHRAGNGASQTRVAPGVHYPPVG